MTDHMQVGQESSTESPNISRQTSDNPGIGAVENNVGSPNNINLFNIPAPGPQTNERTPTPAIPEPAATPEFHIVSNARGPYPQLEMFSVPRRNHTTGHIHRGHGHGIHENKENRALNRIMRKLSDMGFTEGTCPNLSGKVMDQLLTHPPITKDAEEDIVTNMIEELIPSGSSVPRANGSRDLPGAWHQ
jgi:Wiskott-Aldrich syndrome protein